LRKQVQVKELSEPLLLCLDIKLPRRNYLLVALIFFLKREEGKKQMSETNHMANAQDANGGMGSRKKIHTASLTITPSTTGLMTPRATHPSMQPITAGPL